MIHLFQYQCLVCRILCENTELEVPFLIGTSNIRSHLYLSHGMRAVSEFSLFLHRSDLSGQVNFNTYRTIPVNVPRLQWETRAPRIVILDGPRISSTPQLELIRKTINHPFEGTLHCVYPICLFVGHIIQQVENGPES